MVISSIAVSSTKWVLARLCSFLLPSEPVSWFLAGALSLSALKTNGNMWKGVLFSPSAVCFQVKVAV